MNERRKAERGRVGGDRGGGICKSKTKEEKSDDDVELHVLGCRLT